VTVIAHRSMEADKVLEGLGCGRCTSGRRTTYARVFTPCRACAGSGQHAGGAILAHFAARNWVLTTGSLCKYLIEKTTGYTFVAVRWRETGADEPVDGVPWRVRNSYPVNAPSIHSGAKHDDEKVFQTFFVPWWMQAMLDVGVIVRPPKATTHTGKAVKSTEPRLVWPAVTQRAIDDEPFRDALSAVMWLLHDKHLRRVVDSSFAGMPPVDHWPDRPDAIRLIGMPVRAYLLETYPELVGTNRWERTAAMQEADDGKQ